MKSKIRKRREYVIQIMRALGHQQSFTLIFTFQGTEINGNSIFTRIPGLQVGSECLYTLHMHYLDDESRIYGKLLANDSEFIQCIQYLLSTINKNGTPIKINEKL